MGYLLCGGWAAHLCRAHINPDIVAYTQLARHYAAGEWHLAVVGYWSALYAWLLTPFAAAGLDVPLVARLIGVASGLGFALVTRALWRLAVPDSSRPPATLVFAGALLLALGWITYTVSPDMLLALAVTSYLFLSLRAQRDGHPRAALAAGVVGGVAYLVKAYAFPFVLAHLVITTALVAWVRRGQPSALRQGTLVALVAGLGFVAVAGPWIGLISSVEGRLTVSSSGQLTDHFLNDFYCHGEYISIYLPQAPHQGRLTVWEDPTDLDLSRSPAPDCMESAEYRRFMVVTGLKGALRYVPRMDALALLFLGWWASLAALAVFRRREGNGLAWMRLWIWTSVGLYVAGYAVIHLEPRYLWPAAGALLVLTVGVGADLVRAAGSASGASAARRRSIRAVAVLASSALLLSTGLTAVRSLAPWMGEEGRSTRIVELRQRLADLDPTGPVAANHWDLGLFVAFWNDVAYLGRVSSREPDRIAGALHPYGADGAPVHFFVAGDPELAAVLVDHPAFIDEGGDDPRSSSAALFRVVTHPPPGGEARSTTPSPSR